MIPIQTSAQCTSHKMVWRPHKIAKFTLYTNDNSVNFSLKKSFVKASLLLRPFTVTSLLLICQFWPMLSKIPHHSLFDFLMQVSENTDVSNFVDFACSCSVCEKIMCKEENILLLSLKEIQIVANWWFVRVISANKKLIERLLWWLH